LFLGFLLPSTVFGVLGIARIFEDLFPSIFSFGQNILQQRYFFEKKSKNEKINFFLDSILVILFINFIIVILFLFTDLHLFHAQYRTMEIILFLSLILSPVRLMLFNLYRLENKIKKYTFYNIVNEITRILVFIILFMILNDVLFPYVLSYLIALLITIYEILNLLKGVKVRFSYFRKNIYLLIKGFYLTLLTITSLGSIYIIRFFINDLMGLEYVGYFFMSVTILQFIPFIGRAINLGFIPIFYKNVINDEKDSIKLLNSVTKALVLSSLLITVLIFILLILNNSLNAIEISISIESIYFIPVIGLSYVVSFLIGYYQNILLVNSREDIIAIVNLIILILIIVISYFSIYLFQFLGIILAVLLISFASVILFFIAVNKINSSWSLKF